MNEQIENNFINNFISKLEVTKNKEHLIENEINQIEIFTSTDAMNTEFIGDLNLANETNSVFDLTDMGARVFFNSFFHEYLNNGEVDSLIGEGIREDESCMEEIKRALLFAEYYKWLKELKIPKSKQKFSDLNNEQKLLALHFLFPNINDYTNTQLAKVLSQILNIGSENVRRNLSDLYKKDSEIRTIENFEKLIELFENKTFESITNRLKREIKQMS
jgi:hypothetical protein